MPMMESVDPDSDEHKLLVAIQSAGYKVIKASIYGPDDAITVTLKYSTLQLSATLDEIFKEQGYVRSGPGVASPDGSRVSISLSKASKSKCKECNDSGYWNGVPDCCVCKLGSGPDWQRKAVAAARQTTGVVSVKKLPHSKMGSIRIRVSAMAATNDAIEAVRDRVRLSLTASGFTVMLDGKSMSAGGVNLIYDVSAQVVQLKFGPPKISAALSAMVVADEIADSDYLEKKILADMQIPSSVIVAHKHDYSFKLLNNGMGMCSCGKAVHQVNLGSLNLKQIGVDLALTNGGKDQVVFSSKLVEPDEHKCNYVKSASGKFSSCACGNQVTHDGYDDGVNVKLDIENPYLVLQADGTLKGCATPPTGSIEIKMLEDGTLKLGDSGLILGEGIDNQILAEIGGSNKPATAHPMVTLAELDITNLAVNDSMVNSGSAVKLLASRTSQDTVQITLAVDGKVTFGTHAGFLGYVISAAVVMNPDGSETFFINRVLKGGNYTVLASQQFAPAAGSFIPKPDNSFDIAKPQSVSKVTFNDAHGKALVTIAPDGAILVDESCVFTVMHGSQHVTATKDFAKQFWKSLEDMNPLKSEADNLKKTLQMVLTQLNASNAAQHAALADALAERRIAESETAMQRRFRKMLL